MEFSDLAQFRSNKSDENGILVVHDDIQFQPVLSKHQRDDPKLLA